MQGGGSQPFHQSPSLLTTSGSLAYELTTPSWPVGPNSTLALFTLSTPAFSAVTTGESALLGDHPRAATLSAVISRASKRQQTGYAVASDLLERYYSLFLLLFGTLGNVLCFGVLSRKTFRKSTIGIFLRFLTLADLSALWTGVLYFTAKTNLDTNVRHVSEMSCKIHIWLSYACCDLGSWALILVSSARLASILRPMSGFVTNRRAYAAIFLVCVLALSVNLPMFFMYGDVYYPSRGITKHCRIADKSYRYFIIYVWTWIVLFKFAVVPGTILLGLNVVLIVHVYRSKRIIEDMQRSSINKGFTSQGARSGPRVGRGDAGSGPGVCDSCCGRQAADSHGIYQLTRGLASKISFSRWRRKAVVIVKEAKANSADARYTREECQNKLPMLSGEDHSFDHQTDKQVVSNGGVCINCSTCPDTTFQNAQPSIEMHSNDQHKNPEIRFHDQIQVKSPYAPAVPGDVDTDFGFKGRPYRTCSIHESHADIKQLRDAFAWNDVNSRASAGESILFLNHHAFNIQQSKKCNSCSDIPNVPFAKDKGKRQSYDHPVPLSRLRRKTNSVATDSTGSRGDQFFTDQGLDQALSVPGSSTLSKPTSNGAVLNDGLTPGSGVGLDVKEGQQRKSPANGEFSKQTHIKSRAGVIFYDDSVEHIRTTNEMSSFIDHSAIDDSGESSDEEFYSCADETKFSPLLSSKNSNQPTNCEDQQSKPIIHCLHFEGPDQPIPSICIPVDRKARKDMKVSLNNNSSEILSNKELNNAENHLSDPQTINVIVNNLADLSDEEYERADQSECHAPSRYTGYHDTVTPISRLDIYKESEQERITLGGDGASPGYKQRSPAGSLGPDCLRAMSTDNICDINVTRCSSAADNISLKDHAYEKSHDTATAVETATPTADGGKGNEISQVNSKFQAVRHSVKLSVERRLSTHKRDRQVSIADLNLSMSSLGKTSLNSAATDLSSFTIAPPSAFTSAENLTTTTNAENLRRPVGHRKSSAEQHATRKRPSLAKHKRGPQKKTSQSLFPRSSARPKNLTRTLLVINSVFLFCNIPIVIYMTGKTYFFPGGYNDRQKLFETTANFFMYTNNALNFLLYCLTGTRFRHQLRAMFLDVSIAVRRSIRRPPRRAHV